MLTFDKLTFECVGPYLEETTVSLDKQGVVFVRGVNEDTGGSNGSGKTTIFEVLSHILYGTTSKGLKKGSFATAASTKGYANKVEFSVEDDHYELTEARENDKYPKGIRLYKNGEDITQKDESATKDLLLKTIGLTQEEFYGSVYLDQDSVHVLVNGKGKERTEYLSSFFGLNALDRLQDKIKAQLKDLEDFLAEYNQKQKTLTELTELLGKTDIASLSEKETTLDTTLTTTKETIERLKNELVSIEVYQNKQKEKTDLEQQIAKLDVSKASVEEMAVKLEASRDKKSSLQEKRDQVNKRMKVVETLASIATRFGDLDAPVTIRSRLDILTEQREQLKGKLEQAASKLKLQTKLDKIGDVQDHDLEITDLVSTISSATTELAQIKDLIDNGSGLLGKITCPTCGQDVDPKKIESEVKRLSAVKKALESSLTRLKKEKEIFEKEQTKWNKAKEVRVVLESIKLDEDFDTVSAKLEKAETDAEVLRDSLKVAEEAAKLKDSLSTLCTDDVDTINRAYDKAVSKITELEDKIKAADKFKILTDQLNKIQLVVPQQTKDVVDVEYEKAKNALVEISTELEQVRSSIRTYKLEEKKKLAVQSELDTDGEKVVLARRLTYLTKAVPLLKKHKLHEIVEAITEVLPKFIDTMFTEQSLSFVANDADPASIELMAKRPGDVWVPVKALSGGEKKRLSICLIWTLHTLARQRVDLLILDEIDNGLDLVGVEALKKLIEEKKSSVGTILFTSQRESVLGPFIDQVWTVVKNNNVSRIVKGELPC